MGATGKQLHVDALLSEFAMGYRPEAGIADMIFPVVNVQKQSDLYPVFDRGDRLRRQNTVRAPGDTANLAHEYVGSATYFCNNYALASKVPIEDIENIDAGLRAELIEGKTRFLLDHLMLDWEVRVAAQVTNTSNVGSSAAVNSAWNGAGVPLDDLNTALDNVQYSNGKRSTDIVFGLAAWQSFRRDSAVRNLIFGQNNGGGYPNVNQARELLEVDRIHIGGMFQNTGEDGQAETIANIWDDNVLVYARPATPSRDTPSFGYSIRWQRPRLPSMVVERHPYDTHTKSEKIEVGYYQDEKITGSSYGFLLTAVNSST